MDKQSELAIIDAAVERRVREFKSGATRDSDDGKLDYEGFFSPQVERRRAEYMHKNRVMADGTLRDSDNWQKGIPLDQYMKSLKRHLHEVWEIHRRGWQLDEHEQEAMEEALCAVMFNAEGYLFEMLQDDRS